MNGSPSVKVALFIREGGSESPCRWFYVTEIYSSFELFVAVMSATMCNVDAAILYVINKTVFFIDPTTEFSLKITR